MRILCLRALCSSFVVLAPPVLAAPFATEVVSYTAGSNVPAGYDDPTSSLGSPQRAPDSFGDITPFNSPYTADQVVSIGAGGELVVRFDHQVADDSLNPYGLDLLIYGNAFLGMDYDTGLADGTLVFSEPARVAVSQDGTTWFDAAVFGDALFPTLAYSTNPNGPFGPGGSNPTSYTRPVDPSLTPASFAGLDINQVAALYGGGGGGAGIDLAALGLPWIEYVRVWQPAGDVYASEIDAFADVPEPAVATLFGVAALALTWRRARTPRPSR